MVAPTAFTFNEQTAQDNHFMHAINNGPEVRCRHSWRELLQPSL